VIWPGRAEDFNTWSHSEHMVDLYRRRAIAEAPEMTCSAQAAEILAAESTDGDSVLDVGCGSGWFIHSLRSRSLHLRYVGLDKTREFIEIGRAELPVFGVDPDALVHGEVEYVQGQADHVVCLNVLTNIDNWHRALDRMSTVARKTIILRESIGADASYRLVTDEFLDPGVSLKVHVNRYSLDEISDFMSRRGFTTTPIVDVRTGGQAEDVIGYPHYWTFLLCRRMEASL
jgi:ubiquinone/menaquinone biosynthesis C-methylase UbiE